MKTGDLVRKFGVSEATIRRWASTFSEFLTSGENRHRNFTLDDIVVIATIHKLSNEGYTQDLIQKKLQDGYRVEADMMDNIGYPDGRMVPAPVVKQVIDSTEIRVKLERVEAERDQLLILLKESNLKREKIEDESRKREETLRLEIQHLQEKIVELGRMLGRAEGRLEEIDRIRKPNSDE